MELCIKTEPDIYFDIEDICFNPCFNGTMYKNAHWPVLEILHYLRFNPCFNGTMYKNCI